MDAAVLAHIMMHECLHIRGSRHRDMAVWQKRWWDPVNLERFAWARGVPIQRRNTMPTKKKTDKSTRKAAVAAAPAKTKKEKAPKTADDKVVFAFRLSPAERDAIHKAAGPRGASRFVREVALAAAAGDKKAFATLVDTPRTDPS